MKKRILLLSFIAFTVFKAQAQIPSYVPSNGLVGWWPFNGNANDESGNGNNGVVNGATMSNDRNGIANSAYYFSSAGCDPRIDFANFNYGGAVNYFSMSFWMNRVNDGCISPRLFEFGNGNGWGVNWINSQTSMDWVNNNTLQDNIWYHVIYVIQPGAISSYINGVFDSQSSIASPNFGLNVCFGRMNHPSYDAFNGNLDDIGIWNRALTQQEITDLYNGTNANAAERNLTMANVHPNPTSGEITITSNETFLQSYSLYNSLGQLVASGMLNPENTTLTIQEFAPGIYTLQLQGEKNTTLKIVKE